MTQQISFSDVELISAYLDGQLSAVDKARLETRLKTDPQLRTILDDLGTSRALLRKLPARLAPRNFTLTPKMAGVKPPVPRTFPFFRLASAMAAILFIFAFAANLSGPALATIRALAPAPLLGMGGGYGGGGGGDVPPEAQAAAPAAPAQGTSTDLSATPQMGLAMAPPTATPELPAGPSAEAKIMPTPEALPQPAQEPVPLKLPVPAWLQFGLLGLAVITAGVAYFIQSRAEKDWFKARSVKPGQPQPRQVIFFILAVLLVLALALSIYYVSNATFFAPIPRANAFPGAGDKGGPLASEVKGPTASGDKGGPPAINVGPTVSGGDKGSAAAVGPQGFTLTAGLGYNFSTADHTGLITALEFPPDALTTEMLVTYITGLTTTPPEVIFFPQNAFSVVPSDKNVEPQKPFTIQMDYSEDIVAVVPEEKLLLYWWVGSAWQDAALTCNPASEYIRSPDVNRLALSVCKMGSFVLVAP